MNLDSLAWNASGLLPVVAQDAETGEVRMVAYANQEAVAQTLRSRRAHFFSRSRGKLWQKGETSGHTLAVRAVWVDCDGDTLIYLVDPSGPSCHTGAETCFFRRIGSSGEIEEAGSEVAAPTLSRLERTLALRARSTAERSYTKSLLNAGATKVADKVREEATEFGHSLIEEGDQRVAEEGGDLVYHLLVGLVLREVPLRQLLAVLSGRFGRSGHEEKAARKRGPT